MILAFHMFVDPDPARARRIAGAHVEAYFRSLLEASQGLGDQVSADYKGYEEHRKHMATLKLEKLIANGAAWVGSPAEVRAQIERYQEAIGGFDFAALQVNFHTLAFEKRSARSSCLRAR